MVRILIALDDRVQAAEAQATAVEDWIEAAGDVEAYLLHVFRDNPEGASVTQVETVRDVQERLEAAGVTVELLESSGNPADEILRYAESESVDQICVGGRKRTPAGKALFGSVTQEVILGTDLPVMVCGSKGD